MKLRTLSILLALATSGCLVPLLPVTETEVIRAADSTAVFGPRGEFRFLNAPASAGNDLGTIINWDPKTRTYVPSDPDGGVSVRVARLIGETYLIQAQNDDLFGDSSYALLIARVSPAGDVTPLGCALTAVAARSFAVDIIPHEYFKEVFTEVKGDRGDIVALLKAELPKCKPLSKFDVFIPPTATLATGPLP